jgi:hypothetical protein
VISIKSAFLRKRLAKNLRKRLAKNLRKRLAKNLRKRLAKNFKKKAGEKLCPVCHHLISQHLPSGCIVKDPHGQYNYCRCYESFLKSKQRLSR